MQEKSFTKSIIQEFIPLLWKERRFFYWVVPITFILSCALILCVPRYYTSTVVLAPESSNMSSAGSLSSLVSSFGINIGSAMNSDAIYPSLYPDVIGSTGFRLSLLDVKIPNSNGQVMTYRENIDSQAHPFWWYPKHWLNKGVAHLKKSGATITISGNKEDSSIITIDKETNQLLKGMTNDIKCSVDMRTDVISIHVTDQDPLVAAVMADSIRARLQNYIIEYRTNKMQIDLQYFKREMDIAEQDYMKATEELCNFEDAHKDIILAKYGVERERLTQKKEVAYTMFSSFQSQYLGTRAKIQERTPSFTIIEHAVISPKPAGPKRMIFVAVMTLLSILGTAAWILRKEIIEWF